MAKVGFVPITTTMLLVGSVLGSIPSTKNASICRATIEFEANCDKSNCDGSAWFSGDGFIVNETSTPSSSRIVWESPATLQCVPISAEEICAANPKASRSSRVRKSSTLTSASPVALKALERSGQLIDLGSVWSITKSRRLDFSFSAFSFISADSRSPIIRQGTPAATPSATSTIQNRSQFILIFLASRLCSSGSLKNISISSPRQPTATTNSDSISIQPNTGKYNNRRFDFIIICGIATAAIAMITAIAAMLKTLLDIRRLKNSILNRDHDHSI